MNNIGSEVFVSKGAGKISEFVRERVGQRSRRRSNHRVSLQSGEELRIGKRGTIISRKRAATSILHPCPSLASTKPRLTRTPATTSRSRRFAAVVKPAIGSGISSRSSPLLHGREIRHPRPDGSVRLPARPAPPRPLRRNHRNVGEIMANPTLTLFCHSLSGADAVFSSVQKNIELRRGFSVEVYERTTPPSTPICTPHRNATRCLSSPPVSTDE